MHNEEYWNQFYSEHPFKNGKVPSPFLSEMLSRLKIGKTLDIGMGEGVNSLFLTNKGFSVKGIDSSSVAITHAQNLCDETGVSFEIKKVDLDLFLFGLLEYDTIVMTYFKPPLPRYYSEIVRALKQGGTLLVESFGSEEQNEIIGNDESYRDIYFRSNELLHQLKGLRILFYNEGIQNGRHVVQCVAQKPLDKDAAKYGLFDMQSNSKEVGMSAQQKLAEALFKKKD